MKTAPNYSYQFNGAGISDQMRNFALI